MKNSRARFSYHVCINSYMKVSEEVNTSVKVGKDSEVLFRRIPIHHNNIFFLCLVLLCFCQISCLHFQVLILQINQPISNLLANYIMCTICIYSQLNRDSQSFCRVPCRPYVYKPCTGFYVFHQETTIALSFQVP